MREILRIGNTFSQETEQIHELLGNDVTLVLTKLDSRLGTARVGFENNSMNVPVAIFAKVDEDEKTIVRGVIEPILERQDPRKLQQIRVEDLQIELSEYGVPTPEWNMEKIMDAFSEAIEILKATKVRTADYTRVVGIDGPIDLED